MSRQYAASYAQPINIPANYQMNQQTFTGQTNNGQYLNVSRNINQPSVLSNTNSQIVYQNNTPTVATTIYRQQPLLGSQQVHQSTYQQVLNPNASFSQQQSLVGSRRTQKVKYVPVTNYVPVYQVEETPVATIPLHQVQHVSQRIIMNEPEAFRERVQYQQDIKTNDAVQQTIIQKKVVKVPKDSLVQTTNGAWHSQSVQRSTIVPPPVPVAREDSSCCSPWLLGLLGLLALGGILAAIFAGKNTSSQNITMTPTTRVNGTVSSERPVSVDPIITNSTVNGTTTVTSVKPIYQIQSAQVTNVATKVSSSSQLNIAPQSTTVTPVNFVPVNTATSNFVSYPNTNTLQSSSAQPVTYTSSYVQPTNLYSVPQYQTVQVQPTVQPQVIQPQAVQPTVQSQVIQPQAVQPQTFQSSTSTIQPVQYVQQVYQPTVQPTQTSVSPIPVQTSVNPQTTYVTPLTSLTQQTSQISSTTLSQPSSIQPITLNPIPYQTIKS